MTYTNIASPYTTAGNPDANFNFNRHSWTRFSQDNPNFSKTQFKVALQQLQQAGVLDSSRGYVNEPLRTEILQGTPGITSDQNPLGQYQGVHGNLGLKSYEAAKGAGWKPQDIYDEIQSGRSGMFMPEGAMNQYYNDLQIERDNAQIARDNEAASATATFRADLLTQQQSAAAEQQRIQEEMAAQAARVKGSSPTGVGGAASIKGSRLSITESGGRKGTKRFARPTQYMNTLGMISGGTGSAGKSPITP